jgi:hypothetical protein
LGDFGIGIKLKRVDPSFASARNIREEETPLAPLMKDKIYQLHGSLNVPIEHHPTIRYMVYNGYFLGDVQYSQNGTVTNP